MQLLRDDRHKWVERRRQRQVGDQREGDHGGHRRIPSGERALAHQPCLEVSVRSVRRSAAFGMSVNGIGNGTCADNTCRAGLFAHTAVIVLPPRADSPMAAAGDVDVVHVDAEGAGTNRFGDLQAVGGVGGPDRSGQAVLAVVGDTNRVALVGILQHRQHRTEDLLLGDAHLVGGVGEQRGPDIPTAVVRAVVAADDDACALVDAGADVALHTVLLALGDKGTDVGGLIGRITDLQARHHLRERVDHLVVAAFTNQDPGLQHTPLPVVHQPGCLQSRDGAVDVRVIENDRCGLAAQLQTHPLELLAADRSNPPPAGGGAGERDLVHAGMPHQVLAGVPAARNGSRRSAPGSASA